MTHVVIFIFWFFVLASALYFLPFFRNIKGLEYRWLLGFFLLKIIAGQIFIFIYTYYFDPATADLHRFFNESLVFYQIWQQNPADFFRLFVGNTALHPHLAGYYPQLHLWHYAELSPVFNDNKIVIGFNALANLLTSASLHSNAVIANFVSLAGLTALFKFALCYTAPGKWNWLKYGIFLFPSVLFWGSGLIKEIFLIPAMGFFIFSVAKVDLQVGNPKLRWLYLAISAFIMLLVKTYVLVLLLPVLAAWFLEKRKKLLVTGMWFIVVPVFTMLSVWVTGMVFPEFNFMALIAKRQNFFMNFSLWVEAGSIIHEVFLQPTLASILQYAPRAFFNVLMFPHILQQQSIVSLYAALENLIIIAMLVGITFSAIRRKGMDRTQWLCLIFLVLIFTFVGTMNQVSGTLVRLKIPALPFLWILFVGLVPVEEVKNKIMSRFGHKKTTGN